MMKKSQVILMLSFLFFFENCNDRPKEKTAVVKENRSYQDSVIVPTRKDVVDTVKKSLPAVARKDINGSNVTIRYHSPAVRDRVIWGGLVPYNQVWVTGAHLATTFESNNDFMIGGKKISAGKYAFFTIPGKDEWTVILNKNWQQHLTDEYNAAEDLVRLTAVPHPGEHQERLMYTINQDGERRFTIEMRWEKVSIRVPVALAN